MPIERKAVKSSQIATVGYDPAAKVLEVEFLGWRDKPNALYQYDNVPQEIYDGFFVEREADGSERSVGRYFTNAVKRWPLKYPFRKVELEQGAAGGLDGMELYKRYAALTLKLHNCGMDAWHELEGDDRETWNKLAKTVRNA